MKLVRVYMTSAVKSLKIMHEHVQTRELLNKSKNFKFCRELKYIQYYL
jgi:hypothetical protein